MTTTTEHVFTSKLRGLADITIEAQQDELEVRGNALASGDDAEDTRTEDEIIARLDSGDVWAWATVKVTATWSGFEGSDTLGACSYESEENFKADGHYTDMVSAALEELAQAIEDGSDEKARALADTIGDDASDIVAESYGEEYSIGESRSYRVLTEDEADTAWDESLDSYLDECVLPELPEHLRNYFDTDSWKSDAKYDGRGHSLSSYDGDELDGTDPLTDESFVIFRTN